MRASSPWYKHTDVSYNFYAGAPWRPRVWHGHGGACVRRQGNKRLSEREWPRCQRRVEAPMAAMPLSGGCWAHWSSLYGSPLCSPPDEMEAVGGWRHVQGCLRRLLWSRSARLRLLAASVKLWRRLLRDSRRKLVVWYTTSITRAIHTRTTLQLWRCIPTAVTLHHTRVASHLEPSHESAFHQGMNSVLGPARGLCTALSITLLFGPAHHGVIHDACGSLMRLRYPDSAFIYVRRYYYC